MAWDDQGNGKSPWDPNKGQPPDLDQIVEEWQKRFNKLFGGKSGSGNKPRKGPSKYLLIAMGLILWNLTGLYQIDDSNMPTDIQFLIDNDEIGLVLLRLVEVIGQDEIQDIGSETLYFIISALNQLDIDPLRNKILLKVLPLKVKKYN